MSRPESFSGIFQYLSIARITIECESPLSIGTGQQDTLYDVLLMRDADGLPTIPGSALAGVLRNEFQSKFGVEPMEAVFGTGRPSQEDQKSKNQYHASRLFISWARVHNSENNPAPLNLSPSEIETDEILKWLSQEQPVFRDHVALNDKGTARDTGKFSRGAVPTGTRFTFEILLECYDDNQDDFNNLMACINKPTLSLGGATHRGYGQVRAIDIIHKHLDLKTSEGLEWLSNDYTPDLATKLNLEKYTHKSQDEGNQQTGFKLSLAPDGFYRFGGGDLALRNEKIAMQGQYEKEADAFVKTERIIEWNNNKATISDPRILIPAASIKGAIRHRTAFHARRLSGNDEKDMGDIVTNSLFGYALKDDEGHAGRVHIKDRYLEFEDENIGRMSHNAIDRFTQGTIDGALFDEELVYGLGFDLEIIVEGKRLADNSVFDPPDLDIRALELALEDIVQGRLPLGAGASSGHGFFTGTINENEGATS